MPLISSRKRRTSSSMTYKILCFCLCLLFIISTAAYAADAPAKTADILLIYDEENIAVDEADVERMCTIATSMGKSLAFGDIGDFKDSLGKFGYVICYRLEEIDQDELRAVCDYEGNLMIFGSEFMKRYLGETQQSDLIGWESDQDRGIMRYDFSFEDSFEEIVDVENIAMFITEDEGSGTISVNDQTYPFCTRVGGVKFTPVTSLSAELVQAALMQELTYWMWPYLNAPPDYGQYLVLDCVYPFMNAEELLEKIEVLNGEDIPYIISVMPIYKNASYPAMVQFCQVLQYAQQHGAFVIMHAPIVQAVDKDNEEMYKVLTDGLTAYMDNGVYPLGIEVPVSWTHDDFYLDVMKRYRTVFVYNDDENSGFDMDSGYNKLYYNYHQLVMPVIALDKTGASYTACYSSAIYLDAVETDVQQIKELMETLKHQRVPFRDLWELEHSVWANELHLSHERGKLYLNDEKIEMTYEPVEYNENYDYNRDIINRITISLKNQNKLLTIVTVIVVLMFAVFMIYLRRINKRSLFYEEE